MSTATEEALAARSALGDAFDRVVRDLNGRPDTIHTQAQTITVNALVTDTQRQYTVQTYRVKDEGDTVLLTFVSAEGSFRISLPAKVTACIARQREALASKNRRIAARHEAARRKAAGIKPAFLNGKHRGKRKKKATKEGGEA